MQPTKEVRVVEGAGKLDAAGAEAAALGSRALVVSLANPEPRLARLLERLSASLQESRVGQQPFPRVPRPGAGLEATFATAAEAAREGRCRLVIGLGDDGPLDVARAVAAAAMVPSLLIPTAVGFGLPARTNREPLPDVLVCDPGASQGSAPRRTAGLGLGLATALIGRYSGPQAAPPEPAALLEQALRTLIDQLPRAVRSPDLPGPRAALASAVGQAAVALAGFDPGRTGLEQFVARIQGSGADPVATAAALLPAAMEACAAPGAPLARPAVATFGRQVLGIREADDGRAALWAAGGVRQWVRSLGFEVRLPSSLRATVGGDDSTKEILAVARR